MNQMVVNIIIVLISILLIYILMYIYKKIVHHYHHKQQHKKKHKKINKKCESDNCLDNNNYNDCPCHNKKNNKPKELFTMAQSIFPLHFSSIPAFSQIVNENMANLEDSFMENTSTNTLTREYPSIETSTGFFNVLGDASLQHN
jgi:hypothetical protein